MNMITRWEKKGDRFVFYNGQKEIDLIEWNKEMNKEHPMDVLERNPNPLIRIEENDRRRRIINLVPKNANNIIADVGCEKGYNSKALLDRCAKIYCIDIDSVLLKKTRQFVDSSKADYVVSDAQNIKLKDNSVDVAISSHVLEHLPDPAIGLSELVRITKPSGCIVINLPNEIVVLKIKRLLKFLRLGFLFKGLNMGLAPGHLHIFNRKKLLEITNGKARIVKFGYNFPFYTNMFALLKPNK